MSTPKTHLLTLTFCLLLSAFMLVDHFCIPSSKNVEVIIDVDKVLKRKSGFSYTVETDFAKYFVNEKVYERVDADDSITVLRSILTVANQKVEVKLNGVVYRYNLGSTGEVVSIVLLSVIIVGTLFFIIFYDKLRYKPGRTNLTAFIVIFVFAFLWFHFR